MVSLQLVEVRVHWFMSLHSPAKHENQQIFLDVAFSRKSSFPRTRESRFIAAN